MIRVGVLGISEGNGHPFSFSAIINGYSPEGLEAAGWPVINAYVRRRHASEFGVGELRVTHAWTQDPNVTDRLCKACLIENRVADPLELIGSVDAVILARDDYDNHRGMAAPFLEAGLPVLVDKPLTLSLADLEFFEPYLDRGQLMSCSAMRFATELDAVRSEINAYGRIRLIRGTVLNDWAKYGVHVLDAILPMLRGAPVSIGAHDVPHESLAISTDDGVLVTIDALGDAPKTFRVDVFGSQRVSHSDISDNFGMFRRMLWEFDRMVRSGRPAIPAEQTVRSIRLLIGGRQAIQERRTVLFDEI